jgi:hypothetical protein
MSPKVALLLSCFLLLNVGGCKKRENPPPKPRDVCALITLDEIQMIQDSPMTENKSSARADGGFRVSQCFYTATEFSKSVTLALVQRDSSHAGKRSARDYWKEKFGRYSGENKEDDDHDTISQRKEEKEESVRPTRIDGIGEEAFWVSNRFGGVLYVLKGDAFISIGLGGTDKEDSKLSKSKALAQKALQRL